MPEETSILKTTKRILGVAEDYSAFDTDVITHINSTFTILNQMGIGPSDGFGIENEEAVWEDFGLEPKLTRMVRTYTYLKVRMLFDPPTTSFLIDAINKQIEEHEVRLSWFREEPFEAETLAKKESGVL